MIIECLKLFYVFFKVGALGFGGGYAMMSMIISEAENFSVTMTQFADLNALDMIVPGPIAINAATYVGYLHQGFWGALAATIGVSLPSLIIVSIVMHFINKYAQNKVMNGVLSGVKPAAVGLIAAAAITIASGVLLLPGASWSAFFANPLQTVSLLGAIIFILCAVINICYNVNPILLTLIAGVVGAIFIK